MELIAKSTVDFRSCVLYVYGGVSTFLCRFLCPTWMPSAARHRLWPAAHKERPDVPVGFLGSSRRAGSRRRTLSILHKVTKKIRYWPSIFRKLSLVSF